MRAEGGASIQISKIGYFAYHSSIGIKGDSNYCLVHGSWFSAHVFLLVLFYRMKNLE